MNDDRAIRVFVSSTFRDMQAERDELVKRVFPLLRRRCEERGVAWSEVDLRWGVTDEQAAEGAVLPICLAEIERTRPYFIGLLGQRYGWVPDEIDPDLAARLGWLTEDLHRSVTELEILHGVLNNPGSAGHAYFYLRDPAWVASLPEDERVLYVEADPDGGARLEALRERVRSLGSPVSQDRDAPTAPDGERPRPRPDASADGSLAGSARQYAGHDFPGLPGPSRGPLRVADYGSPEELGERVLADFEALIDELYPASRVPDAATRAAAVHEAFGRARFGLHVPRPQLQQALSAAGSPLLVTGESGSGASSLVTTWAAEWAAVNPGATVLVHHCDADAAASDFRLLAARVIAALGGDYDAAVERLAEAPASAVGSAISQALRAATGRSGDGSGLNQAWGSGGRAEALPGGVETLPGGVEAFPGEAEGLPGGVGALPAGAESVASEARQVAGSAQGSSGQAGESPAILVVLDGVDQLAEGNPGDRAPDLRWLPAELANLPARFVLTGSGERARTAFAHRGWPVLEVPPLTEPERRAITATVLAAGAKQLDEENLAPLVAAPATGNPRFLVTVLDELRQHGDHFTLRPLIDRLVAAPSVEALLELVLDRYERDFERDRPGLVADAMRALWAARYGLAEAELLDLLTPGPEHLPQRTWAPLHLAAEWHLVSRGGLLGFAHTAIRRAVEQRYLATSEWKAAAHQGLARYFASEPLGPRVADELGWQWAEAGDTAGLRATLSDLRWVEFAYSRNPFDLRRLWYRLTPDVASELLAAYAPVLADPAAHDTGQLTWGVSRLLADAGASEAALGLQRYLVEAARRSMVAPEPPASVTATDLGGPLSGEGSRLRRRYGAALVNLGANHLSRGELDAAAAAFEQAAEIPELRAAATGNLAIVRREQRRWPDAETLFRQADEWYRAEEAHYDIQANLASWIELRRNQVDHDGALALLREQERICRELADPVAIGRALAGQAVVLADQGRPADALPLLEEYAAVCRAEGDLRGLAEARLNEAAARFETGDSAEGVAAASEAEHLARGLGDPALLTRVLVARASAAVGLGDWPTVERYAREAHQFALTGDQLSVAAVALGLLGTARREQGDLAGAHAAHTDEAALAARAGDRVEAATAQANLGNVAAAAQRWEIALQHYDAAEPELRALGAVGLLVPVLANRAQLHQLHQRLPQSLADYTDAAEAAARAGNLAGGRQWAEPGIQLAYQLNDVARAERLWPVLASAARASGDQAGLQRALGEHALLLINRAQANPAAIDQSLLSQAAGMLAEQEAVCRATSDWTGLTQCVGNRAIVQRHTGDLAGALASLDEQLRLAQQTGNAQAVLIATANRGEVLGLLGRVPEAIDALTWARQTAAQYGLTAMVQQLDVMIANLRAR